ncbi:MAG: NmrA family NAD(P)-binding protein [Rhizobiaceae bacterium]
MSTMKGTIVILGAAGRIGDAAARAFVEAGWRVKCVGRNARLAEMAPGVEPVRADAADGDALTRACDGADVILNALNPQYDEWDEKVIPMARNVAAAAKAAGATVFIPGNVYNFGHSISMNMREDAPQMRSTQKAGIRIELEGLFRQLAEENGVQTLILRAGDFYGGRKTGSWLDLMILSKLHKGVFTWPGPLDLPHSFAYLPDLGRAFVHLADRREELSSFDRFHFGGHTLTGQEMFRLTEQETGRKLKKSGVPWPVIRLMGLFKPLYREVAIMSYLWRTAHSLDGSKFDKLSGSFEATSPADAIGQAIADLDLDGNSAIAA